jgi:holin-like protein
MARRVVEFAVAFAALWALDAGGAALGRALHVPVPGTVIGIVALFGGFVALGRVPGAMEELARLLLGHLSLLYIPAAVGVVGYASLVRRDAWPIVAALVGSALVGLVVTGWTFQAVDRRTGRGREPS